jgi:hypothetical protein
MAKKNFLDRYKKGARKSGRKKSKSISFDEEVLEAIVHNAGIVNVSVSTLVQDAVKELGLDIKQDIKSE